MTAPAPSLPAQFFAKSFPCTPLTLLQTACELLGTSTAFYAYLDAHYMHIQQVVHSMAASVTCAVAANTSTPLSETYCQFVYRQGQPLVVPDARSQSPFATMEITQNLGIGCYVGVPLFRQDGTILGTLCGLNPEPLTFSEHDTQVLQVLALALTACFERQELQEQLDQQRIYAVQAYRDALTNLPNRRAFDEAITINTMQAASSGQSLAVLFLDLDHFKYWNDTYGHVVGDQVLQFVARQLSGMIRQQDQLFRLGGEEFVILMPAVAPASVAVVAERLRASIHKPITQIVPGLASAGAADGCVSGSFGVAFYPHHAASSLEVVREADKAMYHAKRLGRNQICFASIDDHQHTETAA